MVKAGTQKAIEHPFRAADEKAKISINQTVITYREQVIKCLDFLNKASKKKDGTAMCLLMTLVPFLLLKNS